MFILSNPLFHGFSLHLHIDGMILYSPVKLNLVQVWRSRINQYTKWLVDMLLTTKDRSDD